MLKFAINCEYVPHHNWMSLASYYSIQKLLPKSEIIVLCKRKFPTRDLFKWPQKCNVDFLTYSNDYKLDDYIIISPTTMAVRAYDEIPLGPISVKSSDMAVFVDYDEGCGKFVVCEWINKVKPPFVKAVSRFALEGMTANEMKVLKLWEKVSRLCAFL